MTIVQATSTIGLGSTFTVRLTAQYREDQGPSMNRNIPSILIVDDEQDACQNLADILVDFGYRVDVAYDGLSALNLVRDHTYDMALLDYKMPGMDGLTLYREIKKLSSGTVAILVTAYAANATANEALAAGARNVFPKPVDFPMLIQVMTQALDRPLMLIVDDDVDLCGNLWDLLNESEYRVYLAHDEDQAAARLTSRAYDVVLIDMKLPQGDGQGVYERVRQTNPLAHVIAITGCRLETEQFVQQIIADGANAVCYKPFDVPELLNTIGRLTKI